MSEKTCDSECPHVAFLITCENPKGHTGNHFARYTGGLISWDNENETAPTLGVSVEETIDTKDKPS